MAIAERKYIDGKTLRAEKARHELQWVDLQETAGLSRPTLIKYANGLAPAPVAVVAKLEQQLQLTPGMLVLPDQQAARVRARQLLREMRAKAAAKLLESASRPQLTESAA